MQAAETSTDKGSRFSDRGPFVYVRENRQAIRGWLLYVLLLVLASVCVLPDVAADPAGSVYAGNDDSSLFIWWLAHAAEVLASRLGLSGSADGFLYTHEMNALAGGVNGAWNTSLLGPALLLAPVTWIAGPIISYNLLILAIPVVNSVATAVLFRRFLRPVPAFTAAAGVGFSSYTVAQMAGHPNLALAFTPPLVAAAILGLLALPMAPESPLRRHGRFRLLTAGLGMLLGFQFYVSTEVLAGTFLAALCLLACLAASRAHPPRAWLTLLRGGVLASALALLIALPLLLTMLGPNAPSGAIRPHGVWNTDLLDPIIPAGPPLIGAGSSPIPRVLPLDGAEIGGYMGIPALIAAAVIVIGLRRTRFSRLLLVTAATGILVFSLSLGSPVLLGGRVLSAHGPFALVEAVPVLNNLLPMRLVVHSVIALCAILGVGLQWALDHRRSRRGQALLALLAVAAVVAMPGAQTARAVHVPEFHRNGAEAIPEGSVVKTLPRPLAWATPHADEAMVWQAVSGFRYRETGGYFIGSSRDSPLVYSAPEDALDRVLGDAPISAEADLPDPASAPVADAVDQLRAAGVDHVVLAPDSPLLADSRVLEEFLTACLGPPSVDGQGVLVYPLSR
ncbi:MULTISPECIES: hypothetical protein [Brevibacterium]|uniref:hypothetical protein n=1 Tax=Brevibacterium TaxID=1696 RepID=UPI000DEB9D6E|nr:MULTISPECIES: hypothetical protein [Brevibacterium]